jgi:hypothetical protein
MKGALLLALLLAAPARAFEATGEVRLGLSGPGSSAAFDEGRVAGPNVNLTRIEGGAWAGDIRGQNVALQVTGSRLSAPNFEVTLERSGQATAVRGNVFGRRYHLDATPQGLRGRVGYCSVDLERRRSGLLTGQIGCMRDGRLPVVTRATMKLLGQAGDPAPPLPQFALALIAIFP